MYTQSIQTFFRAGSSQVLYIGLAQVEQFGVDSARVGDAVQVAGLLRCGIGVGVAVGVRVGAGVALGGTVAVGAGGGVTAVQEVRRRAVRRRRMEGFIQSFLLSKWLNRVRQPNETFSNRSPSAG